MMFTCSLQTSSSWCSDEGNDPFLTKTAQMRSLLWVRPVLWGLSNAESSFCKPATQMRSCAPDQASISAIYYIHSIMPEGSGSAQSRLAWLHKCNKLPALHGLLGLNSLQLASFWAGLIGRDPEMPGWNVYRHLQGIRACVPGNADTSCLQSQICTSQTFCQNMRLSAVLSRLHKSRRPASQDRARVLTGETFVLRAITNHGWVSTVNLIAAKENNTESTETHRISAPLLRLNCQLRALCC